MKDDASKHTCDCGEPAAKKKGNAYVCATCDRIEKQMYGSRSRRILHAAPKPKVEDEEVSFGHAAFTH